MFNTTTGDPRGEADPEVIETAAIKVYGTTQMEKCGFGGATSASTPDSEAPLERRSVLFPLNLTLLRFLFLRRASFPTHYSPLEKSLWNVRA